MKQQGRKNEVKSRHKVCLLWERQDYLYEKSFMENKICSIVHGMGYDDTGRM